MDTLHTSFDDFDFRGIRTVDQHVNSEDSLSHVLRKISWVNNLDTVSSLLNKCNKSQLECGSSCSHPHARSKVAFLRSDEHSHAMCIVSKDTPFQRSKQP